MQVSSTAQKNQRSMRSGSQKSKDLNSKGKVPTFRRPIVCAAPQKNPNAIKHSAKGDSCSAPQNIANSSDTLIQPHTNMTSTSFDLLNERIMESAGVLSKQRSRDDAARMHDQESFLMRRWQPDLHQSLTTIRKISTSVGIRGRRKDSHLRCPGRAGGERKPSAEDRARSMIQLADERRSRRRPRVEDRRRLNTLLTRR